MERCTWRVIPTTRGYAEHFFPGDQPYRLTLFIIAEQVARLNDGVDIILEHVRNAEVPHGSGDQVRVRLQKMVDQRLYLLPGFFMLIVDLQPSHQMIFGLDVIAGDRRQVTVKQMQDVQL